MWLALTRPALTATYLYGLAARSDWRPGSPITFSTGEGSPLTGEVLAAHEPLRLSYSLSAGDSQPVTYLTWEIVEEGRGSVVRLYVDEREALDGDSETDATWSRVMARLGSVLAWGCTDRAAGGRLLLERLDDPAAGVGPVHDDLALALVVGRYLDNLVAARRRGGSGGHLGLLLGCCFLSLLAAEHDGDCAGRP